MQIGNTWAIVVATEARENALPRAVAGTRRATLGTTVGHVRSVVPRSQIYTIVDVHAASILRSELWSLPASAVLFEPHGSATGTSLLLALLLIERQNPLAQVLIVPTGLPETHLGAFLAASSGALRLARRRNLVVMLGDGIETDGDLAAESAWEHALLASSAATLLGLYEALMPEAVNRIRRQLRSRLRRTLDIAPGLPAFYDQLPRLDLGTALLRGEDHLRIVDVAEDRTREPAWPAAVSLEPEEGYQMMH